MTYHIGQQFTDVDADEFGRINKAANAVGLMALVSAIRDDEDDRRLITFQLVSMYDA